MGTQFRKIGTTVLAAAIAVALSAPAAFAQDTANAPDPSPAFSPSPFHINATFLPDASDTLVDQAAQSPQQSSHHEGFGFGILGGLLFSSLGTSPLNGAALSTDTGEAIGIFFGGNRPGRVGVEGQLLYNVRKGKDINSDVLSIHSLEIPVLIRVNVGSQSLKGVLGYIIVGPAVDLQLNASLLGESVTKNYKGVNLDVLFGGGIEITRFFIEGREDIGLRGVNSGNFANATTVHTHTFALLVGFRVN
jgi:hypothetical protein